MSEGFAIAFGGVMAPLTAVGCLLALYDHDFNGADVWYADRCVPWLVARYCERSRERTGTPGGTAPRWGEIDLIRLCNSERFLRLLPASPQQS